MDKNFYEPRSQPRARRVNPKEKPKNAMMRVIAVQFVLSLIVTGVLFAVCRTESELSKNIKLFYSGICENDMTTSEILATFKKVAQFTFAPSTEWDGTFFAEEETTESETENMGETETTAGEKVNFSPAFLTVNFKFPIDSRNITSRFGYRNSPISGEYSFHSGVDIAAPEGTKISAAYDGIVAYAGYNEVNGNYIVIEHSKNLKTTYNHCSKLLVKSGDKVKRGETAALVGSTGASTGNHLHFEVVLNGRYVNPLMVI